MFVFPLKRYFWGSLFWANPPKTLQKESSTTRTICVVQLAVDIWRFPQMGDPQNAWFTIEHPTKMDDLVVPVPPFQETCIYNIILQKWRFTTLTMGWSLLTINWNMSGISHGIFGQTTDQWVPKFAVKCAVEITCASFQSSQWGL